MLSPTHRGVLVPVDMQDADEATLDAYAVQVKRDSRSFLDAYYLLEDAASELGVDLSEL